MKAEVLKQERKIRQETLWSWEKNQENVFFNINSSGVSALSDVFV